MVKDIRPLTDEQIEQLAEGSRDKPWINDPRMTMRAVQQGDRRIEYDYQPSRGRDWLLYAAAFAFGVFSCFVAYTQGLDRGVSIGAEACSAGDLVSVDPAVQVVD